MSADTLVRFASAYADLLETLVETWVRRAKMEKHDDLLKRHQTREHWADEFLMLAPCTHRLDAMRIIGDALVERGFIKPDYRRHKGFHGPVAGSYRISRRWLNSGMAGSPAQKSKRGMIPHKGDNA